MHKFKKLNFIVFTVLMATLILTGCEIDSNGSFENSSGNLLVHYIDVGQGDSVFIQLPNGETSLIDGGPRSSSSVVVDYLKDMKVEKIDYLIATHPHEDHIGGLPEVIKNYEIGAVYMPDRVANTTIFERLLKEINGQRI